MPPHLTTALLGLALLLLPPAAWTADATTPAATTPTPSSTQPSSTPPNSAHPSGPTRLFILSGQSNMAHWDPAESFIPALTAAFPGDDLVVVKVAVNGQQIRMWLADWQPPATLPLKDGAPVTAADRPVRTDGNGRLYRELLTQITAALHDKPAPVSVAFCWMQGEADARAGYGAVYESALRELHRNLCADLQRDDLRWVIGRLSDYGNTLADEPDWNAIRDIQETVAASTPATTWIDCDDLNGAKDTLHYTPAGYRLLGERFAAAAVKLIRPPPP